MLIKSCIEYTSTRTCIKYTSVVHGICTYNYNTITGTTPPLY